MELGSLYIHYGHFITWALSKTHYHVLRHEHGLTEGQSDSLQA